MKSSRLFFLALLLGLFVGCAPDLCEDVECGMGDCIEGTCYCPDGFLGVNCEIEECFGVGCVNGNCDTQTETCICHPNYYGEGCNVLCVNGEFANGNCNCAEGYEGITCETEVRCRFLGWWSCQEWTSTSQTGGAPTPGATLGSIKFEEGYNVFEVEFSPTENSNGLISLTPNNRIVGQVTANSINFELQYLSPERTVYGSASMNDSGSILSFELYFFNSTTSFTEVVRGTFILYRRWKD